MKLHPHIKKQVDKYRSIQAIDTRKPVQLDAIELEVLDIDEVIVLATLELPSESFEESLPSTDLSELNKADTRRFIDMCGYRSGVNYD